MEARRTLTPGFADSSDEAGIVLALVQVVGYPLDQGWIVLSIILYLVTGAFWLPVVWMQARMRRRSR